MMRYALCLLGAACGLTSLFGCTPGYPDTAPVQGTVTLDSKPLGGGEIQFVSSEGQVATGRIGRDGQYRLMTFQPDDGAVPGAYRVVVRAPQVTGPFGTKPLFTIPERYVDPETSGLTANVNEGFNVIDFELELDPDAGEDELGNEE
jgi:hypothetical protein